MCLFKAGEGLSISSLVFVFQGYMNVSLEVYQIVQSTRFLAY